MKTLEKVQIEVKNKHWHQNTVKHFVMLDKLQYYDKWYIKT